jgi:hypothetical protein
LTAGLILALLAALDEPADPARDETPWAGPGRFCGYATEIDLAEGETISPGRLGIHSAAFEWSGKFGTVSVSEVNWAAKPRGTPVLLEGVDRSQVVRVARLGPGPTYALWNGKQLAAYVSGAPLRNQAALAGILRRIALADHAGERSKGCKYRMLFSWE